MDFFNDILYNLPLVMFLAGAFAYVVSTRFNLYPVIISVSKTKGLMNDPDERMSHSFKTPNLGGLGVFISFSLVMLLFVSLLRMSIYDISGLLSILSALIILLFLGVKDDLVFISAKKKFLVQLIAVSMVCILEDIRITSFQGLLGVYELPYFASILFSIFVFMLVINALNLIDGIDGLASGVSILASACFGIFFLFAGYYLLSILSAVLVGSLLGFLKYNLSEKSKIFMGDCGSMIVGFLLAYQGIKFLNIQTEVFSNFNQEHSAIFLLAVLSYPLFDLFRVFTVRLKQGKSPFDPDRNHIHHRLLRIGLSHKQGSLLIVTSNFMLTSIAYFTINLPIHLSLLVLVAFSTLVYLLPFLKVLEEYVPPAAMETLKVGVASDRTITGGQIHIDTTQASLKMKQEEQPLKSDVNAHAPKVAFNQFKKDLATKRTQKIKALVDTVEDKKIV